MTNQPKTILETPRLLLREMTRDDYPALAAILRDAQTMYAYEGAFSEEETRHWLDKNLARYKNDGFGLWAVVLKENGTNAKASHYPTDAGSEHKSSLHLSARPDCGGTPLVGQAGITMQDVDGEQFPEIGYLLNRRYWGRGYATEAAIACKRYAFETLGFDEICSIVRDINLPSMNVAIRNGMLPRKMTVRHFRGVDMPHYVFSVKRD